MVGRVYTITVSAQSFTIRYGSSKECIARPDRATHTSACLHIPPAKRPRHLFFTALVKLRIQSAWLPLFLRVLLCFLLLPLSVYLCCSYCFVRSTLTVRGHIHPRGGKRRSWGFWRSSWKLAAYLSTYSGRQKLWELDASSTPLRLGISTASSEPKARTESIWTWTPWMSYLVSTDLENPEAHPSVWLGTTSEWYLGSLLTSYIQPFESSGEAFW